jgi:hypothetical protein
VSRNSGENVKGSGNSEFARFFWKLVQRQNAISYEWLVNIPFPDGGGK